MLKNTLTVVLILVLLGASAHAELANLKIVTDASPDYSDMDSLVQSITSRWPTDAEKMWALYKWSNIARRQTSPMILHGMALSDPIRQYNDYGFTMCSTVSGVNNSVWEYMGYKAKYWDIGAHTVSEVEYGGKWHLYDNSLSAIYTLCDGQTIAGVQDIGKELGCPASGGKVEKGHIAKYHCLNATSVNGFVTGCDYIRDLKHVGEDCFAPNVLKYRTYYLDRDRGHRFILNLRDNETYTRFYSRQDKDSSNAIAQGEKGDYKADPAYYVPNGNGKDPEAANPRFHIRGNGTRAWEPKLDDAHLIESLHSAKNIKALPGGGLQPATSESAEAVFKVQGGNVLTSLQIDAEFAQGATLALSTNNGLTWKAIWKNDSSNKAALKLVDEVNGCYEVLVKATLDSGATLRSIRFNAITQLNSKTQPQLLLGANRVYVGAGEQTESIVFWPELQAGKYKPFVTEEQNIASAEKHIGYQGALYLEKGGEGHVIFKVDAPTDVKKITYGGRLYVRNPKSHIDFLHSFDNGQTWEKSYSHTEIEQPWDEIKYVTVDKIPAGTRSVLFKYAISSSEAGPNQCSIYAVRMEVNHALPASSQGPLEVTFNWSERQADYRLVERSHTQLVEKLPAVYTINVGGADHPIVNSLAVNLKGARGDLKYGYSDGEENKNATKFVGNWVTYGKNLAEGKPYTVSVPANEKLLGTKGDPEGKKLTDGVVGSDYSGGISYQPGVAWEKKDQPEITVDLGESKSVAAFRIHLSGYEGRDAIKGQVKDKIELLTSDDGQQFTSVGFFDTNLRWKDLPVNHFGPDEEAFLGFNFTLQPKQPVKTRYIKYKLTPERLWLVVSEVQALESITCQPFDMKLAFPGDQP